MRIPETTVELIAPSGNLEGTYHIALDEKSDINDVVCELKKATASHSEIIILNDLYLTVGTCASYNASERGGLVIPPDQSLADYFKQYRYYHGMQPRKEQSSCILEHKAVRSTTTGSGLEETTIAAGSARIRLFRTLRVPDNGREYPLPPGLGTFPLVPVRGYASRLPESITARGGMIMPMYQSEALWISFVGSSSCAVKVFTGGVNAISGRLRNDELELAATTQDYLCLPRQPWLDGFCTGDGVVKQFVAAPLGEGYTVAEQLNAPDERGNIQLDIYPCLAESVSCVDMAGACLDLGQAAQELGVEASQTISMHTNLRHPRTVAEYKQRVGPILRAVINEPMSIIVDLLVKHSLSTWNMCLKARPMDTVADLKRSIFEKEAIPPSGQRLFLDGKALEDAATLLQSRITDGSVVYLDINTRRSFDASGERMGVASGGTIVQKVYRDAYSPVVYDEHDVDRVFIHAVSSRAWECITGMVPPSNAFNAGNYSQHQLPWFRIYDEGVESVQPTGIFASLKSLQALHNQTAAQPLRTEQDIPQCFIHNQPADSVARPCGHHFCSLCRPTLGGPCSKADCEQQVNLLAGYTEPILTPTDTETDMPNIPYDYHDHSVTTLILAQDSLGPLVACR